tara:strand:+ start:29174 stop:30337 length:1164 start_codon:yes stop_codon:yes gene_type:complete
MNVSKKQTRGESKTNLDSPQNQNKTIEVKIENNHSLNDNEATNRPASEPKTIKQLLKESEIDPFSTIEKPPTVLSIDGVSYGTLGNFSCITGKSKSKKTFFLSILIASALDVNGRFQRIKTEIPNTTVLHFDTEQSQYHTQKVSRRIISLIDNEEISQKYYKCFCLRPFDPKTRTEMIKEAIYTTENVKLVVIDGIADLIVGYNNEETAVSIVNDIMKWTAELNIHLITIVHQNKGDNNAKGHLGSIILQKAETVLSVEKDREISNVTASHSRGIDINPISFSVDEKGLPYFVDFNPNSGINDKKIRLPRDVTTDVHKTILNEVFLNEKDLKSQKFKDFLKDTLAKHSINVGETAIRAWKAFYEKNEMIIRANQQAPFTLSEKMLVG